MGKFSFMLPKSIERSLNALRGRPVEKEMPQKRRWRLLQIESAVACNLRYVMCPWREITKDAANSGLMSQEIWESIRPHLSEISSIDFTGGGEPLLQPNLPRWVAEASAAGCDIVVWKNILAKVNSVKTCTTG